MIARPVKKANSAQPVNVELAVEYYFFGEPITAVVLGPEPGAIQSVRFADGQIMKLDSPIPLPKGWGRDLIARTREFRDCPSGITKVPFLAQGNNFSLHLAQVAGEKFPEPIGSTAWNRRIGSYLSDERLDGGIDRFRKYLAELSGDRSAYRIRDVLEKRHPGFKAGNPAAIESIAADVRSIPSQAGIVLDDLSQKLFMQLLFCCVTQEEEREACEVQRLMSGSPEGTDGFR